VDRAIAEKAGAFARDGNVGIVAAVEIFADTECDALLDAAAQSVTNIDALA
jgi:hypothetical protein